MGKDNGTGAGYNNYWTRVQMAGSEEKLSLVDKRTFNSMINCNDERAVSVKEKWEKDEGKVGGN